MSAAANTMTTFEGAKAAEGGMLYKGMLCQPIIDKCEGCERTREFEGVNYCTSYPQPAAKWELGACNFATHVRAEVEAAGKVKINPLKASKRAARGR
ncbi:MAG: hypothetical protein H0S85_05005 [Desulfovibrionaceae bacterium]|jgi:hypothetical protein|nr:hypothetical protein [Desulfovibrionaceae bacterium]